MTSLTEGRRRGRPPASTAEAIERTATALLIERGYEEVSVEEMATAAGISRATFFRYFPSKADVVWASFDRALDRLEGALTDVPDDVDTMAAIRAAIIASIEASDYDRSVWWERSTMMNTVPVLLGEAHSRWRRWTGEIGSFVAGRMGVPESDPIPAAIAWAHFGVYLATLRNSLADPADAETVLKRMVEALDDVAAELSGLLERR